MPYVTRNASGDVVGVFVRPQPSMAAELVADDAFELVEFRAMVAARRAAPGDFESRVRALERREPITAEEFIAAKAELETERLAGRAGGG